jgi:uncharacterized protein (TIGR03435 family)
VDLVSKRRVECIITVGVFLAIAVGSSRAQEKDASKAPLTFEVASIKLNDSGNRNSYLDQKGNTFTLINVTARDILYFAYGLGLYSAKPFVKVEGEARWFGDRYDVLAKSAGPFVFPRPNEFGPLNLMVQSLLVERFKLSVHWETRERQGFALRLDSLDRTLGPGIVPSDTDCDAYRAELRAQIAAGILPPRLARGSVPRCSTREGMKPDDPSSNEIALSAQPMKMFADLLARAIGHPVDDQTRLSGVFDIELTYPRPTRAVDPLTGRETGSPEPVRLTDQLWDQLRLRLVPQRGSVDVLVIDHVERPTDN